MKKNNRFKCKDCSFEGTPQALGTHYKQNLTHKHLKLGKTSTKKSVDILSVLSDPELVTDSINARIEVLMINIEANKRSNEQFELEINRLRTMMKYFTQTSAIPRAV